MKLVKMKAYLLVSPLLAFATLGAVGQTSTQLTVQVTDMYGAVIPEASLTLSGPSHGGSKATTNADGEFTFSNLAPGSYQISVQWRGIGRPFTKSVEILPNGNKSLNIPLELRPCMGLEGEKTEKLTDADRAEIVRQLLTLAIDDHLGEGLDSSAERSVAGILLVPDNIDEQWLTSDQRKRVKLMTRAQLQDLTEKLGDLNYLRIVPMKQHGACVEATIVTNMTVRGQQEDANMAGGGATYEFLKIAGQWACKFFTAWVV